MNKKKVLKKIKYFLRFLPDKLYLQLYYFAQFHKFIDFKNPKTYNEKLNWLKIYDRKDIYTKLVDKYEVKKIVSGLIGDNFIIPTLGVWNKFDEIDFDALPNQFVLKCTHDSEGLVIVKDKSTMNMEEAKKKITSAMKYNFFFIGREWPYKNVVPRIIAEPYIEDKKVSELRDYKFFCFNGEPKMFYITSGRAKNETTLDFFDMNKNHLDIELHYPNSKESLLMPKNFDLMIELCKKLSKDFKHVRLDFYESNGKVYFGEFTFYNFSGLSKFKPEKWDYELGELLTIDKR